MNKMLDAVASFRDDFVGTNPLIRRCLTLCDFGTDVGNQRKDVPTYDQYNTGLSVCEEGYDRQNLQLEGNQHPILNTQSALADQAIARYPGTAQAVTRGFYEGKQMAPVVPGQMPGARPGLTGYIPSAEEALAAGMMSGASNGMTQLGEPAVMDNLDPARQQERERAMRLRGFSLQ
jgi:hypothetical protein|tara:strand:+ start:5345 stop:5872 length:528 start_codon:yes stop_codon:yes gene_type:complete